MSSLEESNFSHDLYLIMYQRIQRRCKTRDMSIGKTYNAHFFRHKVSFPSERCNHSTLRLFFLQMLAVTYPKRHNMFRWAWMAAFLSHQQETAAVGHKSVSAAGSIRQSRTIGYKNIPMAEH